jgi:IS5 family transposase
MIPEKPSSKPQRELFQNYLDELIDLKHPLVQLAQRIDWEATVPHFEKYYCADNGRTGLSIRLQVGMQLLKHMYSLSDEQLVLRWVENPYYQYFCGEEIFQHRCPVDDSTLSRFRRRVGEEGARLLLKMSVKLAEDTGTVSPDSFKLVAVDTTVMPKAIAHPTDGRLMAKCLSQLVALAKAEGVRFRQTYESKLADLQWKIGRYGHARQYRRMRKVVKILCNYLGRITRDIARQLPWQQQGPELRKKYYQALKLQLQFYDRKTANKIYSLHAPEVVCIAKGKSRTPYEFGCKVSVATTAREGLVVDCQALHGNPYDGHTLEGALLRMFSHTGTMPRHALVDRGYRGSQKTWYSQVHITGKRKGRGKAHPEQARRNSVEPIIGHLKQEGLMDRCHLKGQVGNQVHALLCGTGFNLRKILKKLAQLFWLRDLWPSLISILTRRLLILQHERLLSIPSAGLTLETT